MKKTPKIGIIIILLSMFVLLAGCKKAEEVLVHFENLVVSSQVDDNFYPTNETTSFRAESPIVYITGKIVDAKAGMVITADWYYLGGDKDELIYGMTLDVDTFELEFYFSLTKPTAGWSIGAYKVRLFIDEKLIHSLDFHVK